MRNNIAIGICLVSAALVGYLCLFHGKSPTSAGVDLWLVWSLTADWLGKRYLLWRLRWTELVDSQKRGKLRLTGLALAIERASLALLASAGLMWWVG